MATMGSKRHGQLVIDYVVEYYSHTKTAEIAKVLGISESSVYNIAHKLGLKKAPEYLSEIHGEMVKMAGKRHRFTKGHTPWNKGVKGNNNAPEYTHFKTGHIPANYKPVGWTRIDAEGYHWTKVKEGLNGWVMTHRLAWEIENGPIPKGKFLRFIDGNKENWQIENLMLVDRESNMRLNTIHRYPEELKSTMKILSKLKRKLKNHGKEQD
jgi:hypothetical protein